MKVAERLLELAEKLKKIKRKEVVIGVIDDEMNGSSGVSNKELLIIHEFGVPSKNIPERSVMRSTYNGKQKEIVQTFNTGLNSYLNGNTSVDMLFTNVGIYTSNEVKNVFGSGTLTPNKASTIKAKKSAEPLIDQGQLMASIKYEVRDK